ncbi:MAG: hypothetical protein ACRDK8_10650 [Solirubrobacteraceae bacterium]
MGFAIRALDMATWAEFARLAEDHHGVWNGCWCLGFHEEGRNGAHTPAERRVLKQARVREGRAHAALVFDGERCVGGGIVESYPEDTAGRRVSGSFLHNGTVAMFERRGFERVRRIGKHRWVVTQVAG